MTLAIRGALARTRHAVDHSAIAQPGVSMSEVASIRVGSVFDVPEAWRVRDLITSSSDDEILVDFRRTQEFHDFALAVLLAGLARANHPPVAARGLGARLMAVLRYLGCDPRTLEPLTQARRGITRAAEADTA